MTVVIPESCKNWKMAMSCPDISGITDDPEAFKMLQKMLHVVGDGIAWLVHMPSKDLRLNILRAFTAIMNQTQHEMSGAIDDLVELSIWRMDIPNEEDLFGVPLRSSLNGCLKTEEEMQIAYAAYPHSDEVIPEEYEEEEPDGGDDIV